MRLWLLVLALIVPWHAGAADDRPVLRVSLLKTGTAETQQGFVFSGGSYLTTTSLVHSAVLVEHRDGRFLFDAGLGERIDEQFAADMPWWGRLLFRYEKRASVVRQLREAGQAPPQFIVLSHAHWDHGSGLPDFPETPVRIPPQEQAFLREHHPAAVFQTQFAGLERRLEPLTLENRSVGPFERSADVFGDGRVVLVGLGGHTPGSIGLIVRLDSGRSLFFVGDLVWSARALAEAAPKFWLTSRILDHDRDATLRAIRQLAAFAAERPDIVVVPAHDAEVQDALGYFPKWLQ